MNFFFSIYRKYISAERIGGRGTKGIRKISRIKSNLRPLRHRTRAVPTILNLRSYTRFPYTCIIHLIAYLTKVVCGPSSTQAIYHSNQQPFWIDGKETERVGIRDGISFQLSYTGFVPLPSISFQSVQPLILTTLRTKQ